MRKWRSAAGGALLLSLVILIGSVASTLAANPDFPGDDPDASVRQGTPDDPEFDRCESDDEQGSTCSNVFGQQWERFGFAPEGSQNTATYKNTGDPHVQRLMAQNTAAGRTAAGQVSGVSLDRAWKYFGQLAAAADPPEARPYKVGDPSVQIAILDTGIQWDRQSLRRQVALNRDELPRPTNDGVKSPAENEPLPPCAQFDKTDMAGYDINGDGAFNVLDYACDSRVATDGTDNYGRPRQGEPDLVDAQDLLNTFSDGGDDDGNGYVDDIAGWDFFDDDNDPYDASSHASANNHGSGRAEEAVGRTNDGQGDAGVCPDCQVMPLRVWDTFVTDTNYFAQAVAYAADNDVEVVEGAIGGLLNSRFARAVFKKAYEQGVFFAIVSSDLNTASHNFPTTYDEPMMVQGTVADTNGLGQNAPGLGGVLGPLGLSTNLPVGTWFRNSGTTQYGGHAHVVMPGTTGSQATGQAAGAAGLIASFAKRKGIVLAPNEIKQLFTMTAEDVVADNTGGLILPTSPGSLPALPLSSPDPAQENWDQHFGYGRPDLGLALERIRDGKIPPQALITGPDWFKPMNVGGQQSVEIRGRLSAPRAPGYRWKLQWAPGIEPAPGEFRDVGAWNTAAQEVNGRLGDIDLTEVREALDRRRVDASQCLLTNMGTGSVGASGGSTCDPTAPGKGPGDVDPNEPAFTVRVQVESAGAGGPAGVVGEDRKVLFAYRDESEHEGWPRKIGGGRASEAGEEGMGGGEASQRMFDMNGDNRLDIVEPTSSGELYVLGAGGTPLRSFNSGRPVRTLPYSNFHSGAPFYSNISAPLEPLRTPGIGDIDGDRKPEIVVTAGERIYAWNDDGTTVKGFPARVNPDLSRPEDRTRENYVKRGFLASPTLGNLDSDAALEIVAPSLDQHLYVLNGDGRPLSAKFPLRLKDSATPGIRGAEIISTATLGDIAGDGRPEIVVATNEFDPNPAAPGASVPTDPDSALGDLAGALAGAVTNLAAGVLGGTGRVYAIDTGGNVLPGWPKKPGGILPDALPFIGPGHDFVMVNIDADEKLEPVGAVTTGEMTGYEIDGQTGGQADFPSLLPAPGGDVLPGQLVVGGVLANLKMVNFFEYPIAADLDANGDAEIFKNAISLTGLLNLGVLTGQNLPYNHVVQGWDRNRNVLAAYPQAVEDYQLLSSSAAADVSDAAGRELLVNTGLYLLRNLNADGDEGSRWPKFTGGWMFATPAVGDVDGDRKLEVSVVTREGYSFLWDTERPACADAGKQTNDEWWTSRHDEWSTGAYGTDSRPPGKPRQLLARLADGHLTVAFTAPGDDWLCGRPDLYEVRTSSSRIENPDDGRLAGRFDADKNADGPESKAIPVRGKPARNRYVAVLARDEAGNWGRLARARLARAQAERRSGPKKKDRQDPAATGGDDDGDGEGGGSLPFTGLVLLVLLLAGLALFTTGRALRRRTPPGSVEQ